MTHAIRFHKTGGPEVLVWEEVQLGKPGPGEARIRHTAVGLNFVDIYNRAGVYPVPLPSGLGGEGAGVVEEVGSGVTEGERHPPITRSGTTTFVSATCFRDRMRKSRVSVPTLTEPSPSMISSVELSSKVRNVPTPRVSSSRAVAH